uniref:Uncharacterized protein n=1 Tax=Cacopsylla melanoneura TaxID=428564 RepID=A0A8D8S7J4_9HEMI
MTGQTVWPLVFKNRRLILYVDFFLSIQYVYIGLCSIFVMDNVFNEDLIKIFNQTILHHDRTKVWSTRAQKRPILFIFHENSQLRETFPAGAKFSQKENFVPGTVGFLLSYLSFSLQIPGR